MGTQLPPVGVRLVAENEAAFNKTLDAANRKVDSTAKAMGKGAGGG